MHSRTRSFGFSIIELLLALAIIGMLTAVAIPSLRGQRQRAQRIGDAEANARAIAMALETYKADNFVYGPANSGATWTPSASAPTLTGYTVNPAPGFNPVGNTQMTYVLTAQPYTYSITVWMGGTTGSKVITLDQTGSKAVYLK